MGALVSLSLFQPPAKDSGPQIDSTQSTSEISKQVTSLTLCHAKMSKTKKGEVEGRTDEEEDEKHRYKIQVKHDYSIMMSNVN